MWRGKRRRHHRGTGFVLTLLIILPCILTVSALAIDVGRIVTYDHQIGDTAWSAATAAAWQRNDTGGIDVAAASLAATEIVSRTWDGRGGRLIINSVDVFVVGSEVSVTITYTPANLAIAPLLDSLTGSETLPQRMSVTRSAFLCDSVDTNGPTGGVCRRPR